MRFSTRSPQGTKKAASLIAKTILRLPRFGARLIALEGNLGSGKTTFVQGLARALGVKEKIQSPTFVLMKIYKLKAKSYKHLIHIDCYRLDSPKNLLHLGFKNLLKDKDAVILIEWAGKIKKLLPRKNTIWLHFRHGKVPSQRTVLVWKGKEI